MTIEKLPSCDDPFDSLLPVESARQQLLDSIEPIAETESIELLDATGRVLAHDVVSPINVPSFTNSAMDGYALSADSIPNSGETSLKLVGTAWAGREYEGSVGTGEAVRVFTGALMPAGTDTVVIQEHVRADEKQVTIDHLVVPQRNVRLAGEDVNENQIVLKKGVLLKAAEIGLLASLGIPTVKVYRKLRVAFFTTGDELCSLEEHAGKTLAPGMLFDSNRFTLQSMLSQLSVDIIDLGIVRDNPEDTRRVMLDAASQADLIVTSGGQVNFWKLAMRPGRPLAFGTVGDAKFFGLPGNPVAVMVTFLQFVSPAIKRLMGQLETHPYSITATCESSLRKSPGRVEFQRGILANDANGKLVVKSTGKQGAGRISSMSAANCLIVIAADVASVEPGDSVQVQPFTGLFS